MRLTLLDWRRRVHELYRQARLDAALDPAAACERWRTGRDELLASHPQSPLPEAARATFTGCPWWPYDPQWRFEAALAPRSAERLVVHSGTGEAFALVRLGAVELPVGALDVHWVDVYGGGVFLPFTDGTNGHQTYGGGRYLLDTVKGADLGGRGDALVLDFNFAFHPSCAYDPSWSCPLAPPGNRLEVAVEAGEQLLAPGEAGRR